MAAAGRPRRHADRLLGFDLLRLRAAARAVGSATSRRQGEVAGAFSAALLVSGLCATAIGRTIDRVRRAIGDDARLAAAALLLAALSQVQSAAALYLIWNRAGVSMAATLYEPAFVVIAQVYRPELPARAGRC